LFITGKVNTLINTVFRYRLSAPAHLPEALKVKLNNELFLPPATPLTVTERYYQRPTKRRKVSPCIKIRLNWILKMSDLPIQL
jgi:hypothetical protein